MNNQTKYSSYGHLQIDWKKIEMREVSKENWNALVAYWKEHGEKFHGAKTINRSAWWARYGTYRISQNKRFNLLQINDNGEFKQYCCNNKPVDKKTADNPEGKIGEGTRAFRAFKEEVKQKLKLPHNCNPIKYAFGEVSKSLFPKSLITSPISFAKDKYVGQILSDIYKADVSSAYPGAASLTLPDAHTFKLIPQRVEPTEEYPFCFYSNGHIAIYNELDSRKWPILDYGIYAHSQEKRIKGRSIEFTICMKASKYSLRPVFEEIYRQKQDFFGIDQEKKEYYKALMNKTIGCFESEDCYSSTRNYQYYAAHLSAVIRARVANQVLTLSYKIRQAGGSVLGVYTDCVLWQGAGPMGISSKEKTLGEFVLEAENEYCTIGRGVRYALQREGETEVHVFKCSSYSKEKRAQWGKPLTTLDNISDFFLHAKEYFYQWNEQTEMYDKIEKE